MRARKAPLLHLFHLSDLTFPADNSPGRRAPTDSEMSKLRVKGVLDRRGIVRFVSHSPSDDQARNEMMAAVYARTKLQPFNRVC